MILLSHMPGHAREFLSEIVACIESHEGVGSDTRTVAESLIHLIGNQHNPEDLIYHLRTDPESGEQRDLTSLLRLPSAAIAK